MKPRCRTVGLWLFVAALTVASVAACAGSDWAGNRNPTTFDRSPVARLASTPIPPPMFEGEATIVARDAGGSGVYGFDPPSFFVRLREPLILTLQSETESHTFTIDPLDIDQPIPAGEASELEVTFRQSGSYTFACSIHPQMTGVVHVQ